MSDRVTIPRYLEVYEECIAASMEVIPFNDPKTMSFGFTASRFEEDREVMEQTLTFSDFYQQRSQESRRIGEYFAQDIKEAAERGRKRKE